ncbi:DEAD/DEAH box helicase [Cytophagaceae bacterium DM2B3-1]|uniref:DEAD-box ATP-dependent RNA helicase RhpA n=1 Tax=Xanthocytophaga flava TaxID=3048013 RepID=A0AAE3QRH2_9BACT|nr:DEAD/DEAH box helicase [Xanthocytophaga flavus]MDJ1484132.1 DEAD/DEAH box helicase [Xanthocytophaga flavus]MDJ1496081.1 DEAD/DEAH box helicase [Xanthocytophaga flavus]
MQKIKFSELPLSEEIQRAVTDMGFEEASPIQSEAIPVALEGRDVIGLAQTGTGKTAAFGIPALEQIDGSKRNTQALILCPTRELAVQVTEELKRLSKYLNIRCVTVYGGDPIDRQIRALREGAQVVVGTPGRVIDHLERKTLKLDNVKIAILDEADEMLDMGFRDDIEGILEQLPEERQTLLFSATMSKEIMQLTKRFQHDPAIVKVVRNELTAENIEQLFFEIKAKAKIEVMCRLIDLYQLQQIVVFCNMKSKVDEVVEELIRRDYGAEGLHGDMRQQARNQVMTKFRAGNATILVATDVAARGIDVSGVDAVFNYDIPLDPEYYVHRIGRTGRAGKSGKAFTFVVGKEFYRLREIETYTKKRIERGVVPSFADVVGVKKAKFIDRIKQVVDEGDLDIFADMIEPLHHAGMSTEDIIKALIKINMGAQNSTYDDADLLDSYEKPRFKDRNNGRDDRRGGFDRDRDRRGGDRRSDRSNGEQRDRRGSGNKDMVRLFVNVGKMDRVRPNDIVGALTGETGVAYDNIGQIDIYEKYSFVEVKKQDVPKVIKGMENNTIKGRPVRMEVAGGKS